MPDKTKLNYRFAIVFNDMTCRACKYFENNPSPHVFLKELCEKYNTYPYWKIPQWKMKVYALIRKHYIECHPNYEIIKTMH